jgi:hypothetical protein
MALAGLPVAFIPATAGVGVGQPMQGNQCRSTNASQPVQVNQCRSTNAGQPMQVNQCRSTNAGQPMQVVWGGVDSTGVVGCRTGEW